MPDDMDKGKKLVSWMISQGCAPEGFGLYLMNMSDFEFDKIMSSSWEMLEMSNKIQKEIDEKGRAT